MINVSWNYSNGSYVSADGKFIAVFNGTTNGHASYWVFPASLPKAKRKMTSALSVGRLPEQL